MLNPSLLSFSFLTPPLTVTHQSGMQNKMVLCAILLQHEQLNHFERKPAYREGKTCAGDDIGSGRGYSLTISGVSFCGGSTYLFNLYLARLVRDSYSDPIICMSLWDWIRGSRHVTGAITPSEEDAAVSQCHV